MCSGNDTIEFLGLQPGTKGRVNGQGDNDTLIVDGTRTSLNNSFDDTELEWSGGLGDDKLIMKFASFGNMDVNVINDQSGSNTMELECDAIDCSLLSRETFLANIRNMTDDSTSVERINVREAGTINKILVNLNEGLNRIFFDDTFSQMDVFGGTSQDKFYIGQLYNAERDNMTNVRVSDPITTTLTTRGWLSNGCSDPISLNGEAGDDVSCIIHVMLCRNLDNTHIRLIVFLLLQFYDVLRNKAILDLNGMSGMSRKTAALLSFFYYFLIISGWLYR